MRWQEDIQAMNPDSEHDIYMSTKVKEIENKLIECNYICLWKGKIIRFFWQRDLYVSMSPYTGWCVHKYFYFYFLIFFSFIVNGYPLHATVTIKQVIVVIQVSLNILIMRIKWIYKIRFNSV